MCPAVCPAELASMRSREPGCARLFAGSAAPGVRPPAGPSAARPLRTNPTPPAMPFGRDCSAVTSAHVVPPLCCGPGPKLGGALRLTGGQGRFLDATLAQWNCLDETGVQGP